MIPAVEQGSSGSGGVLRGQAAVAGSGGARLPRGWVVRDGRRRRALARCGTGSNASAWSGDCKDGQQRWGLERQRALARARAARGRAARGAAAMAMVQLLGSDAWALWHTVNDASTLQLTDG